MTSRMFLAVGLDDDTRHALAAHLEAHLVEPLPGSRAPVENWHITLRYLGKVTDTQVDLILAHLDEHLTTRPFKVRFGGLGAFPHTAKATVGWLAVEADELDELAAVAEAAATSAGLMPEERPFHPHLTLTRIRPPRDLSEVAAEFARFPRTMAVTAVVLYESTLRGSKPALYTERDRVDL